MANSRNVEFSVKAKDEFSKVLSDLERQQTKLSAAAKAANRRSLVGNAKADIDATAESYRQAVAAVDRYRQALDAGRRSGTMSKSDMQELAETIAITRNRSRDLITTLNQQRGALNQIVGSTTSGYTAFNRLASVMEKSAVASSQESAALSSTSAQLKKLTTDTNTAASAQTRLKTALNSSAAAVQKQKTTTTNSKGEKQEVELYGLKPYQMTNLGYQINDVVSGLAMGQRPMQVFAQQAGQIAQIWPNMMVGLVRSIPQIAALTAVLSPFIAAALRMQAAGESMRYFQAQLSLSADGSRYSARSLTEITESISKLGIATDDARKLVSNFVKEGLDASSFDQYAQMAKQLDSITGEGIGEAGARIATAFSGSVKSVRDLDRELNFLTADQLTSIQAMEDSGDKAGALSTAQGILAEKLRGTTSEGSAWSQAMKSMGSAWDSLVRAAERSGLIDWMADEVNRFGADIKLAADGINKLASNVRSFDASNLEDVNQKIRELQDTIKTETILAPDGLALDAAKTALDEMLTIRRELLTNIKEEGSQQGQNNKKSEDRKKAENDIMSAYQKRMSDLKEEYRLAALTEKERYIEKGIIGLKNDLLKDGNRTEKEALDILQQKSEEYRKQLGLLYDQQQSAKLYGQLTGNSANVVDKIIGAESSGNASVKNPTPGATATGLGQFIESTWLRMFKQYFPDRAKGMTDSAILALRTNADLSRQMVELYLRENAQALEKAGIQINDATLYLAHFLGSGGATKLLKAYQQDPNTPVSAVTTPLQQQMNPTVLGNGKTVADVVAWAQKKMAISDQEVAVNKTLNDLDADRAKKAKEFHDTTKQGLEAQQFALQNSLKEGRQAAINQAIYDKQLEAKKAGTALTQAEIAEITKLTGLEYDREHAMDNVNQLYQQRQTLLQEIKNAQQSGDTSALPELNTQLSAITAQLQQAIASARAFYEALGGEGAQAALLKLDSFEAKMNKTVTNLDTKYLPKATQINEQLAEVGSNAFSSFAQAIANGENAADAFFNSLLKGLADFLISIGQAIVKQALLNALMGGSGGGVGGGIAGFIGSLFGMAHTGGVVGSGLASKMVNPSVFAGATRYHTGGVVGLKPNEVPIIAMKDEEVITADDPRHVNNGGRGGQAVNVRNVNVFDPRDVLEQALSTVEGERVILNYLTRNARKVSSAINS